MKLSKLISSMLVMILAIAFMGCEKSQLSRLMGGGDSDASAEPAAPRPDNPPAAPQPNNPPDNPPVTTIPTPPLSNEPVSNVPSPSTPVSALSYRLIAGGITKDGATLYELDVTCRQ